EPEFPFVALPNHPAQQMRNQLLAITDAEHRSGAGEHSRLKRRARVVVNTGRPARDNDSTRARKRLRGSFTWKNGGRNSEIPDLAGDQMAVLAARIQNSNLGRGVYFCILSTRILWALSISACALGMSVMAVSTSGSVLISN